MPYTPPGLLSQLRDVRIALPTDLEVLQYAGAAKLWENDPPTTATTVAANGHPALSGAVVLAGGQNVTLAQAGQLITVNGVAQRARGFSAMLPGVIAAKTVTVLQIPNAVVTQVDAFTSTAAPAGVTSASCANVLISGSISGSLILPLNVAGQSEYHLTGIGGIFGQQQSNADPGGNFAAVGHGIASMLVQNFTPTAAGNIETIVLNATVSTAPAPDVTEWLRVGIVPAQALNAAAPLTPAAIPWVNDTQGNPAFIDVPLSALPTNNSPATTAWQLANLVSLVQGTPYAVLIAGLNPARTGWMATSIANVGGTLAHSDSGSITSTPPTLHGGSNGTANWSSLGANTAAFFQLAGGGTGVVLNGLVLVQTTMTGAPATPGTDLNISFQA